MSCHSSHNTVSFYVTNCLRMRNSLRSSALLAATFVALFLDPLANASRLTPPILPLIVRNPYLSTWLQDAREAPWSSWPMFWTGEEVQLMTTLQTIRATKWRVLAIFTELIDYTDWLFGPCCCSIHWQRLSATRKTARFPATCEAR